MSSNKRIDTSQQENNHNKKRQKVDGSGGGMKVLASETENLDSIDRGRIRRTQPSSPSFVTTKNETKKRSIPPAALEANDKMIWFLTGKPASARSKYAKAFKFPTKLFYALECGEYDEIVAWTPNGCAFQVHKPKDFESKVLPIIFREAKFSSFHRKLNRWNFIKIPGQHGTYSHPLFRRGEVSLCQRITCSNNNDSLAPFPGEIEAMMQSAKKFGNDAIPGAENSFLEQPTSTRRVDDSSLFGPQYPSVLPLSASSQIDGGLNFRASSLGSSISLRGVQQDSSAITSIADAFESRRPGISAATAPGVLGRSVPFQQAYVRPMGSQGGISSRNQTNGHGVATPVDPYSRIAELEDQLVLYRQQMRGGGVPPPLYTDETGNRLLYYQNELASLNPTIDGATGYHSFGRHAGGMVPGLPTVSSYMDPHQQEQLLFSINQSRMIHPNGLHMPPPQQFSSRTDHFQFLQQEGGQLGRNKENSDRALSRQIESRLEFINNKAGANIRVNSGTNGVMKNNPPAGTSDAAV